MTIKNSKAIYDVYGNVMYQTGAKSIRTMVQLLVKAGKSLKGADLSHLDLRHLDLTNGDFSEAKLDGSNLTGAILKNAIFTNSSLRGVDASGANAEYANFSFANMSPLPKEDQKGFFGAVRDEKPTKWTSSLMTYSKFVGATMREVDFSHAAMSSTNHTNAVCKHNNYTDALLHNVDWEGATVTSCNLKNADMTARMKIDAKHLPDRTLDAIIVGNHYENTKIGLGNKNFVADAFMANKLKLATVAAVTTGLFVGSAFIPVDLEALITHSLGSTLGFIIAASALTWIKTPIEDFIQDKASDMLVKTVSNVRSTVSELWLRGKALGSLAVALMSRKHADHVETCLKAHHGSVFKRFKAALAGEFDVIVCDRKHLAEAISRINDAMNSRNHKAHSVILVRPGESRLCPRAIVINPDTSVEAIWDEDDNNERRYKVWAAHVTPSKIADITDKFIGPHNEHIQAMDQFLKGILEEHDLQDLKFSQFNHYVKQGVDDSIIVISSDTNKIDNMYGPALVTPENARHYFRNGVNYDNKGKRIREVQPIFGM